NLLHGPGGFPRLHAAEDFLLATPPAEVALGEVAGAKEEVGAHRPPVTLPAHPGAPGDLEIPEALAPPPPEGIPPGKPGILVGLEIPEALAPPPPKAVLPVKTGIIVGLVPEVRDAVVAKRLLQGVRGMVEQLTSGRHE